MTDEQLTFAGAATADSAEARAWKQAAMAFLRSRGRRFEGCRLKTFIADSDAQKHAMAEIEAYRDQFDDNLSAGRGVVVFGPCGTGKTHILIALAGAVIAKTGVSVEFTTGPELFADLRRAIQVHENEWETLGKFARANVLILDDLIPPAGGITEYQAAVLLRLIDRRYRDCRPTWASLNAKDRAEADARVGPAIVDRLRDGATCLNFNWPTHRRPAIAR